MSEHTPGPWRCDLLREQHTGKRLVTAVGLDPVALVHNGNVHAEADAHLIAAAPDMLETLRLVVDNCGNPNCKTCRAVRATIAKAEGRP